MPVIKTLDLMNLFINRRLEFSSLPLGEALVFGLSSGTQQVHFQRSSVPGFLKLSEILDRLPKARRGSRNFTDAGLTFRQSFLQSIRMRKGRDGRRPWR